MGFCGLAQTFAFPCLCGDECPTIRAPRGCMWPFSTTQGWACGHVPPRFQLHEVMLSIFNPLPAFSPLRRAREQLEYHTIIPKARNEPQGSMGNPSCQAIVRPKTLLVCLYLVLPKDFQKNSVQSKHPVTPMCPVTTTASSLSLLGTRVPLVRTFSSVMCCTFMVFNDCLMKDGKIFFFTSLHHHRAAKQDQIACSVCILSQHPAKSWLLSATE